MSVCYPRHGGRVWNPNLGSKHFSSTELFEWKVFIEKKPVELGGVFNILKANFQWVGCNESQRMFNCISTLYETHKTLWIQSLSFQIQTNEFPGCLANLLAN